VIVGGFTRSRESQREFRSLLLGTRDAEGQLRYRGKVGSGFSGAELAQLRDELEPLRQAAPAFVDPPIGSDARDVEWVAPELRLTVEYGEISELGRLRQARYVGRVERPTDVRLTHPDKLLYPDGPGGGLRKRDVADYVMRVASWMLPHVRDRPLTLVRCPDGITGECFFQKHAGAGLPASIGRVPIASGDDGVLVYATVSDALGLVALVQMDVLEIHLWTSRVHDVERPDRLVFDLDPDVDLEFEHVIAAALELRERLANLDLRSFVCTTGGKGLHVIAPIEPEHTFDTTKQFCRALAERMVADAPERYVALASKAKRRGKIFIDYLRNGRGATSVAPYSLRARPGATVATPLAWDELDGNLRIGAYDITSVPERLAALSHDPWAEFFEVRQGIGFV
jgi:bifunctional non-homologous end joining protein LigD